LAVQKIEIRSLHNRLVRILTAKPPQIYPQMNIDASHDEHRKLPEYSLIKRESVDKFRRLLRSGIGVVEEK